METVFLLFFAVAALMMVFRVAGYLIIFPAALYRAFQDAEPTNKLIMVVSSALVLIASLIIAAA